MRFSIDRSRLHAEAQLHFELNHLSVCFDFPCLSVGELPLEDWSEDLVLSVPREHGGWLCNINMKN